MPQKKLSSRIRKRSPSTSNRIVLLSACLAGVKCRYDGNQKLRKRLLEKLRGCVIIPVCPEQLGGMPTPRSRSTLINGNGLDVLEGKARVIDREGRELTCSFVKGAQEALRIARLNQIQKAYLKEGSPSCGTKQCISGVKTSGPGVTAALFLKKGIEVIGVR